MIKNIFIDGLIFGWENFFMIQDIFLEGVTVRAIATTTATNEVAKPSSGEATRSLDKIWGGKIKYMNVLR